MATKKMNDQMSKRIKALGINTTSEDEARKRLLDILEKNGIEGMEEEDLITLVEIAESFVDENGSTDPDPEPETEEETPSAGETEEELDQLAKEAEAEAESEEEPEEAKEEDKLATMDRKALKKYITANELEITVKKSMTDDDIRDAIRKAEAVEPVEESEPEAEAAEKPAEEPKANKAKAKVAKSEKKEKKEEKKEEKKAGGKKRNIKLNPKNNEEDRKHFLDRLSGIFPESDYGYDWISNAGVTIKFKGANSQHAICGIEGCNLMPDGEIKCNLYFLTMKKDTEILDNMDIEYKRSWSGSPYLLGITMTDAIALLTQVLDTCTAKLKKSDKNLGDNRAKMEENLKKKVVKKSKAETKK